MTIDYNDAAYRELESEAAKDDRIGDHRFMVTKVTHDTWASGDPRTKVVGNLLTAHNAKADFTLSPPPAPEVVKAEKDSWDSAKKKAIASSVAMHRALAAYGVTRENIAEGTELNVKTAKNKDGFIRVVAILPKDGKVSAKSSSDVPF